MNFTIINVVSSYITFLLHLNKMNIILFRTLTYFLIENL
jgi:hypothetical protein